ncbi:hypothetical protein SFRURICE_008200 [Spodoptera frugiperda]|nr:hypothetical protein SFRURICE_008200 [Spodoptera frugiperda]
MRYVILEHPITFYTNVVSTLKPSQPQLPHLFREPQTRDSLKLKKKTPTEFSWKRNSWKYCYTVLPLEERRRHEYIDGSDCWDQAITKLLLMKKLFNLNRRGQRFTDNLVQNVST